jgi:hypothetical protein
VSYIVQFRKQVERNTDLQRRCYDSCNFSSVIEWTAWANVCMYKDEADAEDSVRTFQRINPRREYRITAVVEDRKNQYDKNC